VRSSSVEEMKTLGVSPAATYCTPFAVVRRLVGYFT
jgi:hypothetical protein